MESNIPEPEPVVGNAPVTTVASSVLSMFFDELTALEGYGELGPKLRKSVLVDGLFTEAAIRAALFGDAA